MRILRSQYLKMRNNATGGSLVQASLQNKPNGKKAINNSVKNNNEKREILRTQLRANSIKQRRHSIINLNNSSDPVGTNIKLLLDNIDESIKNINVVVEYTSMDSLWLTRVYKTYENDMWHKKSRLHVFGKKKWFYYCHLCNGVEYKTFQAIKNHLNEHLKFYPYVCKLCCMKYTNRKSATYHLRYKHNIERDEWNDYLTS